MRQICPNFKVEIDSSRCEGDSTHNTFVNVLPPRDCLSIRVSFESRYGMKGEGPPLLRPARLDSHSLDITAASARRDLLILAPSLSAVLPPDGRCRSDPRQIDR